jgi:hypothetical protein
MAVKHSTPLKNFSIDSGFGSAFDTTGRLNIYTGAQPATPDTAASGTLLGTLTLSADAFAVSSGGSASINTVTSATAVASGTAGWFRFFRTGDTAPGSAGNGTTDRRMDGTIGTDMTIDNAAVVSGGTLAVSTFTYSYAQ